MDVEVIAVFIPIILIVGVAITIIYIRKYENLERMAMIEKEITPGEVKKQSNTSVPLRFSLLLMGFGLGLFVAYFLDRALWMGEVAYFSMLFLFGGLGLGLAYIVEERKAKRAEESEIGA